jgi:hypothetical protein
MYKYERCPSFTMVKPFGYGAILKSSTFHVGAGRLGRSSDPVYTYARIPQIENDTQLSATPLALGTY